MAKCTGHASTSVGFFSRYIESCLGLPLVDWSGLLLKKDGLNAHLQPIPIFFFPVKMLVQGTRQMFLTVLLSLSYIMRE